MIAGNPPWLSYRYLKDETYKARVKELTFAHGLLGKDERKLFTQMDTATLFVAQCEREFLRPGGVLGMVLPKTVILPAKQHLAFQRAGFTEVHDFTGVEPLFNVRTCMIVRRAPYGAANVPRYSWRGKLGARNLSLREARPALSMEEDTVSFDALAGEYSPYYSKFFNGASLFPRCLCFVEPDPDAVLNAKAPLVRTAEAAYDESKKEWRLRVEGKVECQFLYGSVLAKDLLPFAVRRLLLVALPVVENSHGDLQMLDANEALSQGHQHAHDWFAQAEKVWNEGRKDNKQSFAQRLNYSGLLTAQHLRAPFIVLTNAAGKNLSAALLTNDECKRIGKLPIRGFVAQHKNLVCYTATEEEAHYLVGVLNSSFVNQVIKPFQTQGLLGERDIERRPFEVCNIPIFDPADPLHQEIAAVSAAARAELLPHVSKLQVPVAAARAWARERVADKLAKLDTLTRRLLHGAPATARAKKTTTAQPELL